MGSVRIGSAIGALAAVLALAGCGAGDRTPTPTPAGTGASGGGEAATLADSRRAPQQPIAFFRAQQAGCRAHARQFGNPQVESARFLNASLVRPLGDGSYLISDGYGTRLVVRPGSRLVLPGSGNETDEMPAPYGAGCPPEVFRGTSD